MRRADQLWVVEKDGVWSKALDHFVDTNNMVGMREISGGCGDRPLPVAQQATVARERETPVMPSVRVAGPNDGVRPSPESTSRLRAYVPEGSRTKTKNRD